MKQGAWRRDKHHALQVNPRAESHTTLLVGHSGSRERDEDFLQQTAQPAVQVHKGLGNLRLCSRKMAAGSPIMSWSLGRGCQDLGTQECRSCSKPARQTEPNAIRNVAAEAAQRPLLYSLGAGSDLLA